MCQKALYLTFPHCLPQIHNKNSWLEDLFYLVNPATTQTHSKVPWGRSHSRLGVSQRPESYRKYLTCSEDLGKTAAESSWNAPTTSPSGRVPPQVWNLENTCLVHTPGKWSARSGYKAYLSTWILFLPQKEKFIKFRKCFLFWSTVLFSLFTMWMLCAKPEPSTTVFINMFTLMNLIRQLSISWSGSNPSFKYHFPCCSLALRSYCFVSVF